ncbi:hypothetical protein ACFY0A_04995 [Streptomyces sp. NPDC001698]|uniref:hypothetical protein n=1 Tax=Streptomyces sp. NPDC001698 TaxID=3364601 RepID=UPI00369BEFBB
MLPVISRKGAPNIKGLGTLRYVVEQTFALLHQFKRLTVRWERRTELHDAFVSLACSLICWRRLKKARQHRLRRGRRPRPAATDSGASSGPHDAADRPVHGCTARRTLPG